MLNISLSVPRRVVDLFIGLLFFLLVSCTGEIDSSTKTVSPQKTETKTLSKIPLSTKAPIHKYRNQLSATPFHLTSAVIKTPFAETTVKRKCLHILPKQTTTNNHQGQVVLMGIAQPRYYLYDPQMKVKTKIPGEGFLFFEVSPDRKKYVFVEHETNLLKIFSANGHLVQSISCTTGCGTLAGWLDNQQLVMVMYKQIDEHTMEYPVTLMLLNPFTNERQLLPPDFPNIDQLNNLNWEGFGTTIYDPTLTRVVYPGLIEGIGMGYILFDTINKSRLVELPSPYISSSPKWLSDGSKFIVNGRGGEFFLVTRDGKVSQLTHMNPDEKTIKFFSKYYSWSPEGKYLAFWLESNEPEYTSLAILDTDNGEVTDFCIMAGYNPMALVVTPLPIWSPDGKAVVIAANFHEEDGGNDVVIVDVEKELAEKIDEDLMPVGWLLPP